MIAGWMVERSYPNTNGCNEQRFTNSSWVQRRNEAPVSMIQEIIDIELRIDGETIAIPLMDSSQKQR